MDARKPKLKELESNIYVKAAAANEREERLLDKTLNSLDAAQLSQYVKMNRNITNWKATRVRKDSKMKLSPIRTERAVPQNTSLEKKEDIDEYDDTENGVNEVEMKLTDGQLAVLESKVGVLRNNTVRNGMLPPASSTMYGSSSAANNHKSSAAPEATFDVTNKEVERIRAFSKRNPKASNRKKFSSLTSKFSLPELNRKINVAEYNTRNKTSILPERSVVRESAQNLPKIHRDVPEKQSLRSSKSLPYPAMKTPTSLSAKETVDKNHNECDITAGLEKKSLSLPELPR